MVKLDAVLVLGKNGEMREEGNRLDSFGMAVATGQVSFHSQFLYLQIFPCNQSPVI